MPPEAQTSSASFSPWRKRESGAGDRLPYLALIDDCHVLLRDGSVMTSLHVPGFAAETSDVGEVNAQAALRALWLRSGIDSRFILYHHIVRRRVAIDFTGAFDDPLSAHIDARWRERLAGGALFVNDQFLTLVRRPARGKTGWPERLGRSLARLLDHGGRGSLEADPADIRALDGATSLLLASLAPCGARQLGDYEGPTGTCSELLELLSALYNGEMRPVRRPADDTEVGQMLPYRRASFGLDAMELRGASGLGFAGILSLKDYPESTAPGLTDPLLRLEYELVLTETWAPCERQIARERIDLAIRRQRAADEEALAERGELYAARDTLGMGGAAYGEHHLSLLVRADSLAQLDQACAEAAGALADAGAVAVREDVNLEPAFWGQFPGNESYVVRKALISSANMADFAALHGHTTGSADGNHWGEAVSLLPTTSATPYFFSFHQADLGNFTIIGPSGSGKTVAMNFLAAQAQRFAPRTILFDKDRGSEVFVRGIGGHYVRIAAGQPTGFNPLALPDSAATRAFLRDWLGVLLAVRGPEEEAMIAAAVDAAYAGEPALRRLAHFGELIGGSRRATPGDLVSRLQPWTAAGPQGWLFDHADDRLDLSARILGFDMTALLDAPALRTPVMMYLFHRIEERLDGHPTMLLIDEGWKMLDDPVFAKAIRDWLKTLRKRNALVGFATQNARDALDSSIAPALVEQTATMIFTPNPRARAEDYCTGFGLSAHELEVIRTLPVQSRCYLLRQGDASCVVRLDLSGMNELITVLSGRESTVRRLDALRGQLGDDPAAWYPALTGAPWPGAREEAAAPGGALFGWTEAAE
jgi:type IV secretion system protein VirB4